MTLHIDWDNHEVIEAEDFDLPELENTIEDVRAEMDYLSYSGKGIPLALEELLIELTELEKEIEDED